MSKRKSPLERDIQNQIRDEVNGGLHNGFVLWRLSQVVAPVGDRIVKGGLRKGASDLIGAITVPCLSPAGVPLHMGRWLSLEIKTDVGVLSVHQQQFAHIIRELGGYYGVARSLEEARDHIERARRGEPCPDYSSKKGLAQP